MSRSKEVLALLKGFQLIAKASAKNNEEYLRQLWSNSSVRDVISNNCLQARQFTERITKNPSKEMENVSYILKETVERTALVAESLYKYGVSQSDIAQKVSQKMTDLSTKPSGTIKSTLNADGFDISAITLKELEQYLSNQYTQKENDASEKADSKIFLNDEKYIKEWMQFIADHKPATVEMSEEKKTDPIQEVKTELKATATTTEKSSIELPELSSVAKQRKVPSSRIGRMASFGGLFAGLGIGTINELTKGALGLGGSTDMKSALFSPKNAERIVDTLCRVRGAALKLGQILSIQDSTIVSPQLVKAFDRVRQAADYMPDWQVEKVLKAEFGNDWRTKFQTFDDKPFAAASIGQVHRATLHNGTEVAIKIQYPGIAQSIESDIDNLVGMLKVWNVFPAGIFIDNVVKVFFNFHFRKLNLFWFKKKNKKKQK